MCLAVATAAAAHHPVGIPQYRERAGEMVMIYNVLTEDYLARLEAVPGRPRSDSERPVRFSISITPRNPEVTFPGGTYLSIVEDLGDRGQREVMPPRLASQAAGARSLDASHTFDRPGDYLVRLEYTESPGQEILEFPLRVTRSGETGGAFELVAAGVVCLGSLALVRAVALRRRRQQAQPGGPE